MAELTVEQLQELASKWEEIVRLKEAGNLDGVKAAIDSLGPSFDRFKTAVAGATGGVLEFNKAMSAVGLSKLKAGLTDVKERFQQMADNAQITQDQLKTFTAGLGAAILVASGKFNITQEMATLTRNAADANVQLSTMSSSIGKMLPKTGALGKMFGVLGDAIGPVMRQADMARNLETSLIRAAAAGGDMSRVMTEMGGSMSDPESAFQGLADHSARFIALTTDIGTANNISADTAANYAVQLMKIPGAMRETVSTGVQGAESLQMLDATLKVASGTGQKFGIVLEDVNMLFQNFSSSGEDSLSVVSRMHSAAQALQIPMQNMRSVVKTAAEQFKFLGDNSQAAISIMSGFSRALEGSGVGPQAIQQLASNFTGLVSKMDMAQRAFVSQQTGGPGGLQGAFQMRLEMREGGGEKAAGQVEDTLKKMMGGSLVTLKEAATDSRAAAQYAKQIQMLTTGPLKVAQDEGQAERIIQAMNAGDLFGAGAEMAGALGPEEALQQAVNTGNEIQEQQASSLLAIHNELQRQSLMAGVYINSAIKGLEGQGTEAGQFLATQRQEAQTRATLQMAAPTMGGVAAEQDRAIGMLGDAANKAGQVINNVVGGDLGQGMPQAPSLPAPLVAGAPGRAMRRAGTPEPTQLHVPIPRELQRYEQQQAGGAAATQTTGAIGTGQSQNTIVIKVMSNKDVEQIINVHFDKYGNMQTTQAFGM